jgi:hypothetical protein
MSRVWVAVHISLWALLVGPLAFPIPGRGATALSPEIIFTVPDTALLAAQSQPYLSIYLDNFQDTVAGFQFVLVSERPDLVRFDLSNGGFDTAGTLLSGFEWVSAQDPSGNGSRYWLRCIANANPFDGHNYWGFPPQQGGVALRVPLILTAPGAGDPYGAISVTTPFDFSTPEGISIGVVTDTLYDTTFYHCTEWFGSVCLSYEQIGSGINGYDSIFLDPYLYGYLDTTRVIRIPGSVTVLVTPNCDIDANSIIDIADLSCLVSRLFGLGNGSGCTGWCDADLSGGTDISDLTMLVEYLFFGGPPPRL